MNLFDTMNDAPLGEIVGALPAVAAAMMLAGAATHHTTLRIPYETRGVTAGALIAALATLIALGVKKRHDDRLNALYGVALVLLAVCATTFGVAARAQAREASTIAVLAKQYETVNVVGDVVTEPRPVGRRWLTIVKTREVNGTIVTERVAVLHAGTPPALGFGVTFDARPRPLSADGFHRWLAQQHATVVFEPATLTLDASRQGMLARMSETVRSRTRDAASRHMSDANAGLMVALVTGDRRGINPADVDALRTAGMSHLTAVSGMHLGVFSAGVLGVLIAAGVSPRARRVVLAAALVWFAFVTRFQPSVLRAGLMALIVLYGASRGRVSDARYALSVAVLILVSLDPNLGASVGLQLSAVATSGVLVIGPLLRKRLPGMLPGRLRDVVAITVGAQLAVLPVLVGTFGGVSLAAFPANVLAASFVGVAALSGFVGAMAALIYPPLGAVVFVAATPVAQAILTLARFFSTWPTLGPWGIAVVAAASVLVWRVTRRVRLRNGKADVIHRS